MNITQSFLHSYRQRQIDEIRASFGRPAENSEYDLSTIPVQIIDIVDDEVAPCSEDPFPLREMPIWKLLQERKMKIEVLCGEAKQNQEIPPSDEEPVTDLCTSHDKEAQPVREVNASSLTLEGEGAYQTLMQEDEILFQQIDRVLLESRQQREDDSQELILFTKAVENLKSEAEILSRDVHSLSLQVSNCTRDSQNLQEQVFERKHHVSEMVSKLESVKMAILKNSQEVSVLEELSKDHKENVETVISRATSEHAEVRERITQIEELQRDIIRDRETLQARENLTDGPNTISFLADKLYEATSITGEAIQKTVHETVSTIQETIDEIPSFPEVRGSLSTFQEQIKDLPSQIRDTIKESMKEAAAFLWSHFTNMVWEVIEAISNIGKTILQSPEIAYSYLVRKLSVAVERTDFPLAVLGILSGCAFVATGTPFTFGATAVAGYFFIRRLPSPQN